MSVSSSKCELFCILCSGNSKPSASGFLFDPYLWVMVSVTLGNTSRKSKGEIIQGRNQSKSQPCSLGTCVGEDILGCGERGPESVSKSLNHCKGLLYCRLLKNIFPSFFNVDFIN